MTYNITGIVDALTSLGSKRLGMPNVTLVFSMDMNGMITLKEAYIKMRYEYQEQVPVQQKEVTIVSDKENESSSSDGENANEKTEKATEKKEGENSADDNVKTSDASEKISENGEKMNDDKNTTAVETPVQMATVTKRKIRKVSLRVTSISDRLVIKPLTEEQRAQSINL